MQLLNSKSSSEKPDPVWFVAERTLAGNWGSAKRNRKQAMDDFTAFLIYADHAGEGYSPYDRGRRLMVTGPDWIRLPDSDTDPLVVGLAAIASVLTPDEYAEIVLGTVAATLLES